MFWRALGVARAGSRPRRLGFYFGVTSGVSSPPIVAEGGGWGAGGVIPDPAAVWEKLFLTVCVVRNTKKMAGSLLGPWYRGQ